MTSLEVLQPGPLTTIQDLGRPGLAHLGVPRSGAADRAALRLANALVGNASDRACLETTLVGPRLVAHGQCIVALTGARVPATCNGAGVEMDTATALRAGDELRVGTASTGLRTYVAFAGGIDCTRVLGSSSTDILTGLGPGPLARGQILELGPSEGTPPIHRDHEQLARGQRVPHARIGSLRSERSPVTLPVVLGPDDEHFSAEAIERLLNEPFTVTPASNRVGLRLQGLQLRAAAAFDDLPSAGLAHGSLQVPPSGNPILMLADHPTTGGYPVIAVLRVAALDECAQLRPGDTVRFRA